MSRDYSAILQAISSKLQRSTVEFIYQTAQALQPQAKAILDEALDNYPVGDRNPADALLCLVNEVINVSFVSGLVVGATDTREEMKTFIREWQASPKAQGFSEESLGEEITAEDLVREIQGAKKAN